MIDENALWNVRDVVDPQDFSDSTARAIYCAICDLAESGRAVDAVTVGDAHRELAVAAADIAANTASAANVRAYAESVAQAAALRRLRGAGSRISKLDGDDAFAEAQSLLAACQRKSSADFKRIGDYSKDLVSTLHARCDAGGDVSGIACGIQCVDDVTSGWQPGDLIIIGARPGVGKTAFSLQCAAYASGDKNPRGAMPVLFVSLEMSGEQLLSRLVSVGARIDGQALRNATSLEPTEWDRLADAVKRVGGMHLLVDDTPGMTVQVICARVRRAVAVHGVKMVVIDYLTQIAMRGEHPVQEIQSVTRALKSLARELRIPVILLSQLSRGAGTRPSLSSLRESGAIEQDADVVILLHRPDESDRSKIECLVAKQRNGPTGIFMLSFDGRFQLFTDPNSEPRNGH